MTEPKESCDNCQSFIDQVGRGYPDNPQMAHYKQEQWMAILDNEQKATGACDDLTICIPYWFLVQQGREGGENNE